MKRSYLSTLAKIAGTALITWLLISRIPWDLDTFYDILQEMRIRWFLFSLSGVLIVLGLKSIRWSLLLRQEGCQYSFFNGFHAYLASYTIGLITPGRLGEISRLYYVREDTGVSFIRSFKTIVGDRIFDFAILIWFGATGLLYFYQVAGELHGSVYLLATGLLMFTAWLAGKWLLRRMVGDGASSLPLMVRDLWGSLIQRSMLMPWLLTLLAYYFFYLSNQWIFNALGLHLSIVDIGFILSLMSLATLLPVSVAGFGTREASLVFVLGFYGINPETAIIFSLLQFTAFFLWGGIAGLIFWLLKPVKLGLVKEDSGKLLEYIRHRRKDRASDLEG